VSIASQPDALYVCSKGSQMQIKRSISYTRSWKSTLLIALILSAVFCFLLIFLQPFDTYSVDMPYKNLKLLGYALPIIAALLLIHPFENQVFIKQQKWMLWNELLVMFVGMLLITFLSFLYLNNVVNSAAVPMADFFPWFKGFGLPFAPLMLILWAYLRFRFSHIELKTSQEEADKVYTITGENAGETFQIEWKQFVMAKAQSNYVEIYQLSDTAEAPQKILLRSSLSKITDQLPEAVQVHRSYLINTEHLLNLGGNSRKGWCFLKGIQDSVPVSPKHFKALKNWLQSRP
jgi:hypothetical protein